MLNLDRQVKKCLDMNKDIQLQALNQESREDAMFIKSGPQEKCLACDKNISHSGHVADYKPWKKLPNEGIERTIKVRLYKG